MESGEIQRSLSIRQERKHIREARIDRAGCFAYSAVDGAMANELPGMLPIELREDRRARFMAVAEAVSAQKLKARVGATMQVLIDAAPALGRQGGVGRSYADAPEIDGRVNLLPPLKASKTLKVGEFTRAKIVFTESDERCGLTAELDGVKKEGVPLQLDLETLDDAQTAAGARAQLKEALRLYFRRVMGKP